MPTIDFLSTPLSRQRHKSVTLSVTRWLVDRGVRSQNVIVTFRDLSPGAAFSGGIPLDVLAGGAEHPGYVLVVCRLGPDRDDEFRSGLAEHIATELRAVEPVPFLYIEFQTTSPKQVYLARDGVLSRADAPDIRRKEP